MCGEVLISEEDRYSVKIHTENVAVARKCFTILKKGFKIDTEIVIRRNQYLKKSNVYLLTVSSHEEVNPALEGQPNFWAVMACRRKILRWSITLWYRGIAVKRAFVRGAFLASGSLSAPRSFIIWKSYVQLWTRRRSFREIIMSLGIEAKIVSRKKYYVVLYKGGAQIVDFLGLMEANVSLMNLENIRILKEMRNNVNRKVNCETANINKTVSAAVKQIQDIEYIRDTAGLNSLAEGLEEST